MFTINRKGNKIKVKELKRNKGKMERRYYLKEAQWEKLAPLMTGKKTDRGARAKDNRLFIEGVMWIMRTGSSWRDLPECYGKWHSVYMRFNRWSHQGRWEKLFETLKEEVDLENVIMDSSVVKVHQQGSGVLKKQDNKR